MELKQSKIIEPYFNYLLLIVPYGIETKKDGLTIDIESDF